ncbi:hypothetical protein AN478_06125 [Thiohalorhabdus denitrificans]|uniref:Uncharacterized protein n=1 Tax=Thiohalorhabdus denitrificans TaxID=381306 RepID=A0A0P9CNN5_9GAMM|nr:hypothetical protein [Thiohalorhabdus denitrificans]KPV40728.1 hypothetical protein AN478_06125 [Thiohalorhabdus denitrificans]SCY45853.1 hypothetical protein SAMN05661077_2151 [Thiohalorhabdus denitrificans]
MRTDHHRPPRRGERGQRDRPGLFRIHPGALARRLPLWRLVIGLVSIGVAALAGAWMVAGLLPFVPSVVDLLGVAGVRAAAGVMVAGLLLASIAFADF